MIDTMNLAPPPDAVTLYRGTDLSAFTGREGGPALWPVQDDGSILTREGDIKSVALFQDFYLHIEFWCNDSPPTVTGQGRGNSGVFLQGRYEVQVLDSWGINGLPGIGDCGALYNHAAPLTNASRKPEEWQTYDIFFRAPRFNSGGQKTENARVTVLHNGTLIQNNTELQRQTGGALDEAYDQPGPILLQYHGNDVRYRNVWVQPLPAKGATHY